MSKKYVASHIIYFDVMYLIREGTFIKMDCDHLLKLC